jgi:WS/DGAT/MGAT family acyltransferase
LWEAWLVEGLEGGRWALVFKVHHCMVDGIAGVELLAALLDLEVGAEVGKPQSWVPHPEPPAAMKVLDAWGGLLSDVFGTTRGIPGSVVHPIAAARTVFATSEGLFRFIARLAPTQPLSIEGSIGSHRVWAHACASLADVKTIRSAFGGTVNDIVLAAVTGGYRALLLERGDSLERAVVRSLVPVSTRRADSQGTPDNRVSALLYELPVQVADPVERLEAVHEQMADLKSSHISEAGEVVTSIGNLAPPMLVGPLSRMGMRLARRFGQHSLNTVTTNVPGPQVPLYCLGHEMLEYRPFVPIGHGLRVGTAILSYNGTLFFGVTGDYETVPDVSVVATAAAAGIKELLERAHVYLNDPRPG